MTLESDVKFEKKLACSLENNMRNLANFHQSTQKSQNQDFYWVHLSKVENVSAYNLDLCVVAMKNDEKCEKELACQLKMYIKNLTNFDPSTFKYQNFSL